MDLQCYSCGLGPEDTSAVYHRTIICRWLSNEGIKRISVIVPCIIDFPSRLLPGVLDLSFPANERIERSKHSVNYYPSSFIWRGATT